MSAWTVANYGLAALMLLLVAAGWLASRRQRYSLAIRLLLGSVGFAVLIWISTAAELATGHGIPTPPPHGGIGTAASAVRP